MARDGMVVLGRDTTITYPDELVAFLFAKQGGEITVVASGTEISITMDVETYHEEYDTDDSISAVLVLLPVATVMQENPPKIKTVEYTSQIV